MINPEEKYFCCRNCWFIYLEKQVKNIKRMMNLFGQNYDKRGKMDSIIEVKKAYKIYELNGKPMIRLNNLILKKCKFEIADI